MVKANTFRKLLESKLMWVSGNTLYVKQEAYSSLRKSESYFRFDLCPVYGLPKKEISIALRFLKSKGVKYWY